MRWLINLLTLFSSAGTLICCALPALLVTLGLGAVMAGLAVNLPGLVWLSENKEIAFAVAGGMLTLNGWLLWSGRNAPCPVDPALREACTSARKMSIKIYGASVLMTLVGGFFAFVAPLMM